MAMTMPREVKLKHTWVLDEQIGKGGFGRVFAANGPDGKPVVVKLVPKAPGADRDLLFVQLGGARNVIPILDSGDAGDYWAIVMPRAEFSLREFLDRATQFGTDDITGILLDIATALHGLEGKVVHRDIKPENVLQLNGNWCLADFGISRYAEASTAPDTQKYALSPPYAAPERWRSERATTSTDVYSLGVIAFELLNGMQPFPGPRIEDYREQHLHVDPPALKAGPTALKALVAECLYKAAGARPSPANLTTRLQRIGLERTSGGLARLRDAHLAEVARRSESERLASESRSAAEQRSALFHSALKSGKIIEEALLEAITESAPTAAKQPGKRKGVALGLGQAQLEIFPIAETATNPWQWERPAFDVVAHAGLIVRKPRDRHDYEGRSHSLWYCDAHKTGQYQWFETAFMISPLVPKTTFFRPFLLDPGPEAAKALWVGVSEFQLAWPLEPLDVGDLDEFIDRWANWFADASEGRLASSRTMPERDTPRNWRQR